MKGNPIPRGRGRPRKAIEETIKKVLMSMVWLSDKIHCRTLWCQLIHVVQYHLVVV
jgi:hypothetical protein